MKYDIVFQEIIPKPEKWKTGKTGKAEKTGKKVPVFPVSEFFFPVLEFFFSVLEFFFSGFGIFFYHGIFYVNIVQFTQLLLITFTTFFSIKNNNPHTQNIINVLLLKCIHPT